MESPVQKLDELRVFFELFDSGGLFKEFVLDYMVHKLVFDYPAEEFSVVGGDGSVEVLMDVRQVN